METDLEHFDQFLAQLNASPQHLVRHGEALKTYAGWCLDRVLALSGATADEAEKTRLMAAQVRTRELLAQLDGAKTPQA